MLRTYSTKEKAALLNNLATIAIPALRDGLMAAAKATAEEHNPDASLLDLEDYTDTMIRHLITLLTFSNLPDCENYEGIEYPGIHQLTPDHARVWFDLPVAQEQQGDTAGSDDDQPPVQQPAQYKQWSSINEAPHDHMICDDKGKLRYWVGEFMMQVVLPRIAAVIDDAARKVSREHLIDSPAAVALLRDYMVTELAGGLTMTGYQRDEVIDWSLLDDEDVMRDVMSYPRKTDQQQQGGE